MYIKTKKMKKKIILIIIISIIGLTITALCIQTILKYNIIDRLIIAGKDIAKNEVTTTLSNFERPGFKYSWENSANTIVTSNDDLGRNFIISGSRLINRPGNNIIYSIPQNTENNQIQSFVLTFTTEFGADTISAGMLLRLKKEGDILQGYMLSFNNKEEDFKNFSWYDECGGKNVAVWKFTYNIKEGEDVEQITENWANGDYSNGIQKTLIKAVDYNFSITENYIVTSTPDQIIFQDAEYSYPDPGEDGSLYQNITKIDISSDNDIGDGYGFFINYANINNGTDFSRTGALEVQIFNSYITQL